MPFNEFELYSYAYWQNEKQRIEEYQFLIYNINISPHLDPKELPKSFAKYKERLNKKPVDRSKVADYFKKAMEKFNNTQNGR